jgi:hypothetical protein
MHTTRACLPYRLTKPQQVSGTSNFHNAISAARHSKMSLPPAPARGDLLPRNRSSLKRTILQYQGCYLLPYNGQVQIFGAGCVRFPVQRTKEIKREAADCTPPGAALKFAHCYAPVLLFSSSIILII